LKQFAKFASALILLAFAVTSAQQRTSATSPAASANSQASAEITIDNFSFTPPTLTIKKGTQVTWINHDDMPHAVVSEDLIIFRSPALDTDDKFTFAFTKAGTYSYFCSLHPKMTAKVIVH